MWEYKKTNKEFKSNHDLVKYLNEEGDDNWEIIFYEEKKSDEFGRYFNTSILYKRQKEQPEIN